VCHFHTRTRPLLVSYQMLLLPASSCRCRASGSPVAPAFPLFTRSDSTSHNHNGSLGFDCCQRGENTGKAVQEALLPDTVLSVLMPNSGMREEEEQRSGLRVRGVAKEQGASTNESANCRSDCLLMPAAGTSAVTAHTRDRLKTLLTFSHCDRTFTHSLCSLCVYVCVCVHEQNVEKQMSISLSAIPYIFSLS
jgi:hypothetical protein